MHAAVQLQLMRQCSSRHTQALALQPPCRDGQLAGGAWELGCGRGSAGAASEHCRVHRPTAGSPTRKLRGTPAADHCVPVQPLAPGRHLSMRPTSGQGQQQYPPARTEGGELAVLPFQLHAQHALAPHAQTDGGCSSAGWHLCCHCWGWHHGWHSGGPHSCLQVCWDWQGP